ncbi:MAG: hypothetical protein ACJA0Z_003668 [Halioglobus sp.]|jgi:hypothetical protein
MPEITLGCRLHICIDVAGLCLRRIHHRHVLPIVLSAGELLHQLRPDLCSTPLNRPCITETSRTTILWSITVTTGFSMSQLITNGTTLQSGPTYGFGGAAAIGLRPHAAADRDRLILIVAGVPSCLSRDKEWACRGSSIRRITCLLPPSHHTKIPTVTIL